MHANHKYIRIMRLKAVASFGYPWICIPWHDSWQVFVMQIISSTSISQGWYRLLTHFLIYSLNFCGLIGAHTRMSCVKSLSNSSQNSICSLTLQEIRLDLVPQHHNHVKLPSINAIFVIMVDCLFCCHFSICALTMACTSFDMLFIWFCRGCCCNPQRRSPSNWSRVATVLSSLSRILCTKRG